SDLKGMTLQSAMSIVAVNLKRIIALRKEKQDEGKGKRTIVPTLVGPIVLFSVHARIERRFFSALVHDYVIT
ncbi:MULTISPECIES: hypothetical protein, partial [unclassified Exiguobacterium]|uniref:hypothetical protein n=1 Tax=unclassified Exiguobacterium TaxID=2644629 RepID=UPI001BEAB1B6